MRKFVQSMMIIIGAAAFGGCRDNSPEVQRVSVPAPGHDTVHSEYDRPKPAQAPDREEASRGPTPFYDEPLVIDSPPEARAFVETYKQVGKPRIVVFVNRGLDGQILPVTDAGRSASHETYLRPGEYDEAKAGKIDYEMMEVLLSDWMAADNQVTIISPRTAHRQLTEAEQRDLQAGKPQALGDVGRRLDADVLIQVQAKPTKQTLDGGLQLRVIAEAINIKGGESLARAAVDVQPPLDKIQMNRYTRFLARKLMDGLTTTWSAPAPKKEAP